MKRNTRLTIIAATGEVSRELLEQAVATGHDVTAVVRDPRKLSRPVRTVTADMVAADSAALEPAIAGSGAVRRSPRSSSDRRPGTGSGWRETSRAAASTRNRSLMCARSPAYYEIRVESLLDSHWEAWLGGLQVKSEGTQTIISGLLPDQPALYGLLAKIGDLGLYLISVRQLDPDEPGIRTSGEIPATRSQ